MTTCPARITIGYSRSFLCFAVLVSVPAAFLFIVGISRLSYTHLIFWGGVLAVVWCSFVGIKKSSILTFWFTLVATSGLWFVLLLQTIKRVQFIIENGGMDRADGYGSPLAFLIGFVGEQLFFLPATIVVIVGWLSVITSLNAKNL